MDVRSICTREVATIPRTATVVAAARRMRDDHVGDLVVVTEGRDGDIPVGMITDRDIAVGIVAQDVDHLKHLLVEDVVDLGDLAVAFPEESVAEVASRMRQRGVRRLPVVENGRLFGIVSLDDLVRLLARELHDLAEVPFAQRRVEARTRVV
jgi:CBS domain-containing protein